MGRMLAGLVAAIAVLVGGPLLAGCTSSGAGSADHSRDGAGPDPSTPASSGSAPTSSSSSAPGPKACPPALRATFARAAKTGTVVVHTDESADLIVCRYRDPQAAAGACTGASVSINTAPQAYVDFRRWVDESVQNSSTGRGLSPVLLGGIGLGADWIPARLTLGAATADRWVEIILTCPHPVAQNLALAKALARTAIVAS